jgi:hypothetical protein
MPTLKLRFMLNYENGCLHHHVFDAPLQFNLIEHLGLKVQAVEALPTPHPGSGSKDSVSKVGPVYSGKFHKI